MEGQAEKRVRLPHEVCDHPNMDLSARLVHIWAHSVEVGVCSVISVQNSGDLFHSRMESAPHGGVAPVKSTWSTLGGDTRSLSEVLH